MIFTILAVVFFVLPGVFEAVMDTLQFHFHDSIFSRFNQKFWNPSISWMNKWKDGCKKFGPKFFLSTTLLVFTTDGWHLMKWFRNRCTDLGVFFTLLTVFSIWVSLAIAVGVAVLRSSVFELLFSKILKVK